MKYLLSSISFTIATATTLTAQWTLHQGGPSGFADHSLDYGNGLFVSVEGADNGDGIIKVFQSSDGLTWQSTDLNETLFVDSLQFGNDRFVITAQSSGRGFVLSAPFGQEWTTEVNNAIAFPVAASLTYANGQYLIAGGGAGNRNIAYADSLNSWTKVPVSYSYLDSVAFNGSNWASVSSSGEAFYSTDNGLSWQAATLPAAASNYRFNKIVAGNGIFLAIAKANSSQQSMQTAIYTSTDGITWTANELEHQQLWDARFADNTFAITGLNSDKSNNFVIFTPDGSSITSENLPIDSNYENVTQIAYGDGLWVVTAIDGAFATKGTYTGVVDDNIGSSANTDWYGYTLFDTWADTGSWLGWVEVTNDPYIWVTSLNKYLYISDSSGWAWVPNN